MGIKRKLIKIMKKYECPCCGQKTFGEKPDNTFQECSKCHWVDDGVQLHNPDYRGGFNKMSLNEAKQAYKAGLKIF